MAGVDPSKYELADLMNYLKEDVSYDRLEAAAGGRVGSATLQRFGDRNRPFDTPVKVSSLVAAAEAVNSLCERKTTPWALWVAHGRQFARTAGLWGEPADEQVSALTLLPTGWEKLTAPRLAAWTRGGAAYVAEQRAERAEREAEELRAENERLRAENERLSAAKRRTTRS